VCVCVCYSVCLRVCWGSVNVYECVCLRESECVSVRVRMLGCVSVCV